MHSIARRHLLLSCLLGMVVLPTATSLGAGRPELPGFTIQASGQELFWIPGDPHHHTEYSDGRATVAQVFAKAKEEGLGWVGIVDHRSVIKGQAFQEQLAEIDAATKETGVIGLQGEEIGSRNVEGTNGHLLVYNFPAHDILDNDRNETELLSKLLAGIEGENRPFGIIAHPYDPFHPWSEWGRMLAGGMEIMNGVTDKDRPPSTKVLNRWDWYLGHQLAGGYFGRCLAVGTAGSDGHTAEVGGANPVTYLALPDNYRPEDILAAIRAGRVIASSRQGLLADLAVNDIPIGGAVGLRFGQPLLLFARFAYGGGTFQAGLAEVRFVRGEADGRATVLQKLSFKKPLTNRPPKLEFKVPLKSYLLAPSYYRLEAVFVTKGDPAPQAKNKEIRQHVYTNPVFVRTINSPICLAADRTPVAVDGVSPKPCLSFPLSLDPRGPTEFEARAMLDYQGKKRTRVELVLLDRNGQRVAGSDPQAQGKDGRPVSCHLEPKDLPSGPYTLVIMAGNPGGGTGRVLSQAIFATWRQ